MADSIHVKNGAVLRRTRSTRTTRAPDTLAAPAFPSLQYTPPSSVYRTRTRPLIPPTSPNAVSAGISAAIHRGLRLFGPAHSVLASQPVHVSHGARTPAWTSKWKSSSSILVRKRIAESTGYLGYIQLMHAQFMFAPPNDPQVTTRTVAVTSFLCQIAIHSSSRRLKPFSASSSLIAVADMRSAKASACQPCVARAKLFLCAALRSVPLLRGISAHCGFRADGCGMVALTRTRFSCPCSRDVGEKIDKGASHRVACRSLPPPPVSQRLNGRRDPWPVASHLYGHCIPHVAQGASISTANGKPEHNLRSSRRADWPTPLPPRLPRSQADTACTPTHALLPAHNELISTVLCPLTVHLCVRVDVGGLIFTVHICGSSRASSASVGEQ